MIWYAEYENGVAFGVLLPHGGLYPKHPHYSLHVIRTLCRFCGLHVGESPLLTLVKYEISLQHFASVTDVEQKSFIEERHRLRPLHWDTWAGLRHNCGNHRQKLALGSKKTSSDVEVPQHSTVFLCRMQTPREDLGVQRLAIWSATHIPLYWAPHPLDPECSDLTWHA